MLGLVYKQSSTNALHQDYVKKCAKKAELLFLHPDSLMYETETEIVYKDFYKDKKLFEFSNYLQESEDHDGIKNLVIGKMLDETCSVPVKRFAG